MSEVWEVMGPDPGEGAGARWVTAAWPRPGQAMRVVLLGRTLLGVTYHWHLNRPVLCLRPGPCPHCERGAKASRQWYAAAYDRSGGRDVVLTLPRGAAAAVCQEIEGRGVMRGLDLVLRRAGAGPASRYTLECVGDLSADPKLRSEFDVVAAVARLFGVERLPNQEGL